MSRNQLNHSFERGVLLFRNAEYQKALIAFNKAIDEHPNEKAFFDSRAAVFDKLGRISDALKDAKRVIDLAPDSWQGYARSARLFLKLNKFDAAHKMLDLALDRVNSADFKRRNELGELKHTVTEAREKHLQEKYDRIPHVTKLPVEVLSIIFGLATQNRISKVLVLSQVCVYWRRIILNTPDLWRSLVLSSKTKIKHVDTQLQRAKGIIHDMRIDAAFRSNEYTEDILRNASTSFWQRLRSLTIEANVLDSWNNVLILLRRAGSSQPRLQSLEIYTTPKFTGNSSYAGLFEVHFLNASKETLTSLKLQIRNLPESWIMGLKSLKILRLGQRSQFQIANFFTLLEASPGLEELYFDFDFKYTVPFDSHNLQPLQLLYLSRLEIGPSKMGVTDLLTVLDISHLTSFILNGHPNSEENFNDILRVVPSNSLTELRLVGCNPAETVLISFLENAPNLTLFHITEYPSLMEKLCDRLAGWEHKSKSNIPQLCPGLQDINFSRCPEIRASSLIRIVKSHLLPNLSDPTLTSEDSAVPKQCATNIPAGNQQALSKTLAAPIRSLVIDECLSVDSGALPWLRANVQHVSCVYMTRKQAKKTTSVARLLM